MRRLAAAGCLILALISGCAGTDPAERAAVAAVAAKRREAITTRNPALYLTLLSRDYRDKGQDYAAMARQLTRSLSTPDPVDYRSEEQQITVTGRTAVIRGSYLLRTRVRGSELELRGKEEIRLRKEAGGWKIIGGL